MFNKRQAVLDILNGDVPEFVPWFADLDYWIPYLRLNGLLMPDEECALGKIALSKNVGAGYYLQGIMPINITYNHHVHVEKLERINGQKNLEIRTKYGILCERESFNTDSYTWNITKHMVKTADDLKSLINLYENIVYSQNYDALAGIAEMIGDNGFTVAYFPKSPLSEMLTRRADMESMIYLMEDEPELFQDLMKIVFEKHIEAAEMIASSPCDMIMFPENITSEVISPENYILYIEPYIKKCLNFAKNTKKITLIHMDGSLKGLLSLVAKTGIDIIEAVTPYPAGALTLEQIRCEAGEDVILWGGLPGIYFSKYTSDVNFEKHVRIAIDFARSDRRFILGVADQVPPYTSRDRVCLVNELVLKYGRY